ncbi:MAG: hypothetical protein FWF24_04920 [Alphaproteobacteria bacterium]|nr:hypothetical protein [Alphaproteobacteria bacterium]
MSSFRHIANGIIDSVKAVILKDGTAAYPYDGIGGLYSGARKEIFKRTLGLDSAFQGNHQLIKQVAPLLGIKLIDDMNIYQQVLGNVYGSGLHVYAYLQQALAAYGEETAKDEADRVMRHASLYFVDSLWGDVYAFVWGAGRDRVFFDTEFPRMGIEAASLITHLAKSRDIETVNDGSIMDIRKLHKHHAIETAFRLVCINGLDVLHRLAWNTKLAEIKSIHGDAQELYMLDLSLAFKDVYKELTNPNVSRREIEQLHYKMNRKDFDARRMPRHCGTPEGRLSRKEASMLHFITMTTPRPTTLTIQNNTGRSLKR